MLIVQDYGEVTCEGGGYAETVLWENPAPTSTFASQTITLSDDITNYDQIEFIYAYDTTNQSGIYVDSIIYKVSDFISLPYTTNIINKFALVNHISGKYVCRILGYTGNTQITFNTAYWVNVAGSDNTRCIPIKIIGLKKEFEYKAVSVPANTVITIPTSKKAKGVSYMIAHSESQYYDYIYACWDGCMNNRIICNDTIYENNSMTFGENSIVSSGILSTNAETILCHVYY